MESKPIKRYTAEFKAQALELVTTGKRVSQIAQELSLAAICSTTGKATRRTRSGRAECSAARKLPPQSGERHFKKSSSYPRHQNPSELRQMITDIPTSTGWLYLAYVMQQNRIAD